LFGTVNVERRDQEKYITVFHVVGIVRTDPYSIAHRSVKKKASPKKEMLL
jgi:hypothetical protein